MQPLAGAIPNAASADLLQLPSAREAKLTSKASVEAFLGWIKSPGAELDGVDTLPLREIVWMKTPGLPSHEYLVMKFGRTYLRVERDTDSWLSVLGLGLKTVCRDTISISHDPTNLRDTEDQVVASISFHDSSTTNLWSFATLLSVIMDHADFYNVYTYNCWWFAHCIWSNLSDTTDLDTTNFYLEKGANTVLEAQRLFSSGGDRGACDAQTFGKVQQYVHMAALERASASSQTKEETLRVSRRIAAAFTEAMDIPVVLVICPSGSAPIPFIVNATKNQDHSVSAHGGTVPPLNHFIKYRFCGNFYKPVEFLNFTVAEPGSPFYDHVSDILEKTKRAVTGVLYCCGDSEECNDIVHDLKPLREFCRKHEVKSIGFLVPPGPGLPGMKKQWRKRLKADRSGRSLLKHGGKIYEHGDWDSMDYIGDIVTTLADKNPNQFDLVEI
ncbi:hypothetical protein JAAARDRAFT_320723 [Jaapia argillacea MUCL 33604]|uniref:Uncharacterized protein n=1 Tax=Jaapia argillacea MUCL 33604 TaxID=933084 RepID=A0A067PMS7_9AGAM|nr:hypothetical protein JAAARDRAFT_320723 [Jaapia argillacea MUCL 33604]